MKKKQENLNVAGPRYLFRGSSLRHDGRQAASQTRPDPCPQSNLMIAGGVVTGIGHGLHGSLIEARFAQGSLSRGKGQEVTSWMLPVRLPNPS